jgi:peptidoglycan/LPS O-acetylase OafA/YrhL
MDIINESVVAWACVVSGWTLLTLVGRGLSRLVPSTVQGDARRLQALDGLRGYLAVTVMLVHCRAWWLFRRTWSFGTTDPLRAFTLGGPAVQLFFMVSGAVFYPSLRAGSFDVRKFFVGRVFRIVPLYWLAVLAMLAGSLYEMGKLRVPLWDLLATVRAWLFFQDLPDMNSSWIMSIRYMSNVAHTLHTEWSFYASIPFFSLLPTVARVLRLPMMAVLLILFAVARYTSVLTKIVITHESFYFGMLALEAVEVGRYWLGPRFDRIVCSRVVAAAGLASLVWSLESFPWQTVSSSAHVALVGATIFFPVVAGNTFFGLLTTVGARFLGTVSYSTYMLHGFAYHIAFEKLTLADKSTTGDSFPFFFFAVALPTASVVLLVASGSWRWIELSGQALGAKVLALKSAAETSEVAPSAPLPEKHDRFQV